MSERIDLPGLRARAEAWDLTGVKWSKTEALALLDAVEQMEREHSHHHIPGTAACYGCALLGKFDFEGAAVEWLRTHDLGERRA